MLRIKLLLLLLVLISVIAGLASGPSYRPKDNISTWYLYMNNKELTSSRLWDMRDTAAFISLNTDQFVKNDTVHFCFVFDVFGLHYRTYLYLGTAGGRKELVSDQLSDNVATGKFAANEMVEVADRLHNNMLQFWCAVDKGPAVRLINIKLENGK